MKRILILTAGFGEGHNAAARNLGAAFHQTAEDDVKTETHDLFETCYGRANELMKMAYLTTINNAPALWEHIYNALDKTKLLEMHLPALWQMRKCLAALIERVQPDAVVSTYPLYNYLIDALYAANGSRRSFAQITVVTDSITVNSAWFRCASDVFIVPNEETAAVLTRNGVAEQKVRTLGFPVPLQFAANDGSRSAPGIVGGCRVLFMINFAKREAPALVSELLKLPRIQLTVTVGRDEELMEKVKRVAEKSGKTVEIHGWTPRMPELVMSHHLLISKAGGATVQESIAARTPMIISQVVPGQEQGNAELIVARRCGTIAQTHAEIAAAVESAFRDDARLWREWHANISQLSRATAATDIARFILSKENSRNPHDPRVHF